MTTYILELGYQSYIKKFDPYYERENEKLRKEKENVTES